MKNFIICLLIVNCLKISWSKELPYFSTDKKLLNATWKRPDLRVKYFRYYPCFWMDNAKNKLALSEALFKIGNYRESLFLGKQLLLSELSFWNRGKNYIIIAQNYVELGMVDKARYYFDKAITRKNQYYFYLYARFEEFENNYPKAIELYHKALSFSEKEYIRNAYIRTLHKGLIYFKFRDKMIYEEYYKLATKNPCFPKAKTRIIDKAFIF